MRPQLRDLLATSVAALALVAGAVVSCSLLPNDDAQQTRATVPVTTTIASTTTAPEVVQSVVTTTTVPASEIAIAVVDNTTTTTTPEDPERAKALAEFAARQSEDKERARYEYELDAWYWTIRESQWPAETMDWVMRVIDCESGGNQNAVGKYGERGLFQIHPIHRPWLESEGIAWDTLFDPAVNARVALMIYAQSGPTAWVCSKDSDAPMTKAAARSILAG